jgi:hypothetical protein
MLVADLFSFTVNTFGKEIRVNNSVPVTLASAILRMVTSSVVLCFKLSLLT